MAAANSAAVDATPEGAARPAEQTSGFARLWNGGLGSVTSVLNAIGSVWIFGLMCMMLADLGSRFLLNRPIDGVAEVAGLSIVAIVYLQLGAAVQSGRMTRADFISEWVARKMPRLGRLLATLFPLLGTCTMAGLAFVSFEPFVSAWADRETLGTAGVFLVVTWPFRGLVLLGSFLAALCYASLFVRALTRMVAR